MRILFIIAGGILLFSCKTEEKKATSQNEKEVSKEQAAPTIIEVDSLNFESGLRMTWSIMVKVNNCK